MPKNSLQDQIRSLAEKFAMDIAAQLRADVRREIAEQILGTTRGGSRGDARAAAPAKPARKKAAAIDAVVAYVKANPGQRTEQISKGLGQDAKPALAKLRAEQKVKTKGERRATTYSLA